MKIYLARESLSSPGMREFLHHMRTEHSVYVVWICTLGSALLGDWVWWLLLLVSQSREGDMTNDRSPDSAPGKPSRSFDHSWPCSFLDGLGPNSPKGNKHLFRRKKSPQSPRDKPSSRRGLRGATRGSSRFNEGSSTECHASMCQRIQCGSRVQDRDGK